jgi:hypothetical protein
MEPTNRAPSDEDIDMMLAGGRLGGPAKERIMEVVAGHATSRRAPFFARTRNLLAVGLAVAAGAAALLLLVPRQDHFGPKGVAGAEVPRLEISCAGGTLAACPVGSRLLFVAEGADRGYLAAWADPVGGGERIWYFSRDSQSPALAPVAGTQVAPKAILLGPEHVPGDYTVHVLVTAEPLSRAEQGRSAAIAAREFTLTVVAP